MEKKFFTADKERCGDLAAERFFASAGLNREGRKFERMRRDALRMREAIERKLRIRGQYAYYSPEEFHLEQDALTVGGETFRCTAFAQIEPGSMEGLYVYACSVGDYSLPEESALNQVYTDLWGTAWADAVRFLMKEELERHGNLSDSFGPGFYGMGTREIHGISNLLDFDQLGIEVKESGILVPVKSCAGLYFRVNSQYESLDEECAFCQGNQRSCVSCQIYQGLAGK